MDDKDQNTGHGARKGFPWQPCLAGNANHRDHKWMASSFEQDPPPWLKSCFYSLLPNGHLPLIFSNSLVQLLSCVQLFATPWTAAHQASLSINNSQSLLNSCPLSRWCHITISSSVVPFSSCLQSFPASGSFPRSQFFTSGGQSIGASASASVLPMHIQDWFPLGWTGWISLQSEGPSSVFSNTTVQKHQFFGAQLSL